MAIGHLASTGLTLVVSALSPDDFDFDSIAEEPTAVRTDRGNDQPATVDATGGEDQ